MTRREPMLRILERRQMRAMDSRVDLTRGTYPDVSTIHVAVPTTIRPSQRATTEVESGGETVNIHLYDIRWPRELEAARGDLLTVTESPDPSLLGRWLTVIEVTGDDWESVKILIAQETRHIPDE